MKILAFSPYSGIWAHSLPEAIVLKAFTAKGVPVTTVRCDRFYADFCLVMSSLGIKQSSTAAEKEEACKRCSHHQKKLSPYIGEKTLFISKYLTKNDQKLIENIISNTKTSSLFDIEFDDFPIGKLSAYEFVIQNKKHNLEINEQEKVHAERAIKQALATYIATKKILTEERPTHLMLFNCYYSTNRIVFELAKKMGIEPYNMVAANLTSRRVYGHVNISQSDYVSWCLKLIDEWPKFSSVKISLHAAEIVVENMITLANAGTVFVYSNKPTDDFDSYDFFGIDRNKKIVVATMSSSDEMFAAEVSMGVDYKNIFAFPTMKHWIEELISYFSKRSDLALIIRVHPREFPNNRESKQSSFGMEFRNNFKNLPDNVRINWPEQKISIYDLAEDAALILNAWSSVGKELACLGLPILTYAKEFLVYPTSLNYYTNVKEDYFHTIDRAIQEGWKPQNIVESFRWIYFESIAATFDISKIFHGPPKISTRLIDRLVNKANRFLGRYNPEIRQLNQMKSQNAHIFSDFDYLYKMFEDKLFAKTNLANWSYGDKTDEKLELEAIKLALKKYLTARYGEDKSLVRKGTLREKLNRFVNG